MVIDVPSKWIGLIIGKGGVKIKEIREVSDARIGIPDRQAGSSMGCTTGSQRATELARRVIELSS